MQDLYRLVRKSSFFLLGGKLIIPIVNFLVTVYVIRILSVGDYGIYNILLAVMGYIGLFSSLGLSNVFKRYIPEFYQKNDLGAISKLVFEGFLLRLVIAVLFVIIAILSSQFLGKIFKISEFAWYFKIFLFAILFSLEANLLANVLTSLFLHKYFIISQAIYTFARAIILFYLLQAGQGLNGLLTTEAISFCLLLILYMSFYDRKFRKNKAIPFRKLKKGNFPYKRLARFGLFSYLSEGGVQILDTSTDFFVISAFLNPYQVGLYAFANKVAQLATKWMPHKLLFDVIEPAFMTKYSISEDKIQLNRMFGLLMKILAFCYFPLIAGIIALGDKIIIYIFDPAYISAISVLVIIAIFTGINFFQKYISFYHDKKIRLD